MLHGLIFNVSETPYLQRPLGAHRIAHWLRDHNWDIEVVDWSNWWAIEELKLFFVTRVNSNTKFVAFGHLFSIWPPHMEDFVKWIKQQYPELKIISGSAVNPHFTSQQIDYYIQGFGEYAILELLKYIAGNGPSPRFNLLAGDGRKIISAIESYPAFPMESLMVKYEDRDFVSSDEVLTVELSRGCKFECAFCNYPVLGVKGDHSRNADDFANQLKDAYDRFGVTKYIIADETLNDRTEKLTKFADATETLNFKPYFNAYVRADLMVRRPQDKHELLRMNVLGHFYGIETFNTKSLKIIGKGIGKEQIQTGLVDTRKYFEQHSNNHFRATLGLIVGLPEEDISSLDDTKSWMINHWQGQSFNVHALSIPNHPVAKLSKIGLDYAKYGYSKLESDIVAHHVTKLKDVNINLRRSFPWKNKYLDVVQAAGIVEDWVNTKYQNDFRPGCFALAHRFKDQVDMSQRIKFTYNEYYSARNPSILDYIAKKINATPVQK
jgi:phospholipid N-methyltransferase